MQKVLESQNYTPQVEKSNRERGGGAGARLGKALLRSPENVG